MMEKTFPVLYILFFILCIYAGWLIAAVHKAQLQVTRGLIAVIYAILLFSLSIWIFIQFL